MPLMIFKQCSYCGWTTGGHSEACPVVRQGGNVGRPKRDGDSSTKLIVLTLSVTLLVLVVWHAYRSRMQASLYQREGLDVTTWECSIGARPAERAIRVRE